MTLSAVLHGGILVYGFVKYAKTFEIPEFEFELAEVELMDPDLLQAEEGEPDAKPAAPPPQTVVEPPPPPVAEPTGPSEEELKKKEEEERKKKEEEERKKKEEEEGKRFAKKGTRAEELAPPTSTFHLLLVPRKIRKLPFAETAFTLLQPWPDFNFLVNRGGLDPLKDFDHIIIASPDIRDWRQTFLAVDYTTSQGDIQAAIERAVGETGQVIEWVDTAGYISGNPRPADPEVEDEDVRWFVLHPDKKVAFYVHDKLLKAALDETEADPERRTKSNFVKNLTKMKRFASRQPRAGMQLKMSDLRRAVRKATLPFPMPDEFELSVEAARSPELVIKFQYEALLEAKKFQKWYEGEFQEYLDEPQYRYTLKPYLDGAVLEREKSTVVVRNSFTQEQIELLLGTLSGYAKKMTDRADRIREKQRREREREKNKPKADPRLQRLGPDGKPTTPPANGG